MMVEQVEEIGASQAPARRLSPAEIRGAAEFVAFGFEFDRLPDVMLVTPSELEAAEKEIKAEVALIKARAT